MNSPQQLREDALAIWMAGVDAVRAERLVGDVIAVEGDELSVCGHRLNASALKRIAVIGAGKAGAGMAAAVEKALGEDLLKEKATGWVNVPADCVRRLKRIHLHAARPAGVNEPTAEGVQGAEQILEIAGRLTADDLCLVLISGGGSALLPAPKPPVTLDDKQAVTRFLMHCGATINELNAVRKRLSRIKGGGLARASRAGQLVALIISDVVGDPLDVIASGPTYPDPTTDAEALAVLEKFHAGPPEVPQSVLGNLERAAKQGSLPDAFPENVANHVIGSNAMAVTAAADEAERRGYHVVSLGSANCGEASEEGRALAERCRALCDDPAQERPICLLSGGEPVVHLAKADKPRKGGRNQQLVLAGLDALRHDGLDRIVLLSGGTDGEDGPTDAAGAVADAELLDVARQKQLNPKPYLDINDAYTFFEQVDGLIKTGPTHTNVMDLRVALVGY
ncbi:MAG: glycerate kinase type-2 family protein [Planctomycetota bacterium]|jgi:glycerate-2-kinase